MMPPLAPWSEVHESLPTEGRSLAACFDDQTIWVFAAHERAIADYATEHGRFGGKAWMEDRITRFRLSLPRVMARSERGQREAKEGLLAIRLPRDRFDAILRQAVHWREFPDGLYATKGQWRLATRYAQVVMDWAPDCDPFGADLARFTVRFGVRAHTLNKFTREWVVGIDDLTALAEQWRTSDDPPTPVMRPYPLPEPGLAERLLWSGS